MNRLLKVVPLDYIAAFNTMWVMVSILMFNYTLRIAEYILIGIVFILYVILSNKRILLNVLKFENTELPINKAVAMGLTLLLLILLGIFAALDMDIIPVIIAIVLNILLLMVNWLVCKI